MSEAPQSEIEVCPSCGDFVESLDDETGFCFKCIGIDQSRCLGCDKLFNRDATHRKLCPACRDERWLSQHADELEVYLAYGARMAFAKREVYKNNRPVCMVCKRPITGAKEEARFCKRTIECRRWRRRYRTLRERYAKRGVKDPSKNALAEVSAEVFASEYKMTLDI